MFNFTSVFNKPENIFVALAIVFGMLFIIANPPFQAPDESEHLYKMYGYTIGSANCKILNQKCGQIVPEGFKKLSVPYERLRFKSWEKTSLSELKSTFDIKLNRSSDSFIEFAPPVYSPLSYFPQIFFLKLLIMFDLPPVWIMYLMRIASLLLYTSLMWLAVKTVPLKKYLFALIALLPMSLYVGSSISTDPLLLGISFLYIAYTLKLALDDNIPSLSLKHYIIFAALITCISVCKFPYLPLLLLLFIIPDNKFSSPKIKFSFFFLCLLLNLLLMSVFVFVAISLYQNINTSYESGNSLETMLHILLHPVWFLEKIFFTLSFVGLKYIEWFVGRLGWMDTDLPSAVIKSYLALLLLLSIFNLPCDKTDKVINFNAKIIFALISLICFLITFTAVYISFRVEIPYVAGFQGRYLTPFSPLVFLLLFNNKCNLKNISPSFLISLSSCILLTVTICILLKRFYFDDISVWFF